MCLYNYLSKCESFWTQESQVLVSFVKPHKAVTSSTVSRWLKEGLAVAGIDARMFKGHSTRTASSTKSDVTGVSVCDIIKQGQRSNKSTFQKFYKKEIIDYSESFQGTILSNVL